MPAVIVEEVIAAKFHILDIREKVEQRITGPRNQYLVTRITEEAKKIRVRFTRARGEINLLGRGLTLPSWDFPVVVICDSLTSREQALRLRIVNYRFRTRERSEYG